MTKIKTAIIGVGNIMTNRHLPALKTNRNLFELRGLIDSKPEKCQSLMKKYEISKFATAAEFEQAEHIEWFKEVEAVIIATPPHEHARAIRFALDAGKHVLVEKPFVTSLEEGAELIELAERKKLILAVNHNFQFSSSFKKLYEIMRGDQLGSVRSFYSFQVSNDSRRLPVWGDSLPLGLFYDESPHFFYLLRRFCGGDVSIKNVVGLPSKTTENTPQIINIDIDANGIPAGIYINFESPICEWFFSIHATKKIAIVDMFRDILIVLPHDGQHLMKEVFNTSFLTTYQHWHGFIKNGWKYIRHNLHYGMDVTQRNFHEAIKTNSYQPLQNMGGKDGLLVNQLQHSVVSLF